MDDFWVIIVLADKSWKATELMSVRMWERIEQLYSDAASLRQRCNYKVRRLEKHRVMGWRTRPLTMVLSRHSF